MVRDSTMKQTDKYKITIDQPLNQLFCTRIGPPLLLNWSKDARGGVFLKHIISRILEKKSRVKIFPKANNVK